MLLIAKVFKVILDIQHKLIFCIFTTFCLFFFYKLNYFTFNLVIILIHFEHIELLRGIWMYSYFACYKTFCKHCTNFFKNLLSYIFASLKLKYRSVCQFEKWTLSCWQTNLTYNFVFYSVRYYIYEFKGHFHRIILYNFWMRKHYGISCLQKMFFDNNFKA